MTDETRFITPEWVRNAVFYQIFPERFANGDPSNDPENVEPWGTPPTLHNFMGGDLRGVIDHLDYLDDLGITAIYFTPIFEASSNHKYNISDYLRIDPHFGTLETFKQLLDACHQRGIKVVLDAVLNHSGRGFHPFYDVMENGEYSPYRNWFYIERFPIYPYDTSRDPNYRVWWSFRSLPKLNTWHPPVRRYLLEVARYWLELGIDGWRLDVPNEIDDHGFWREFRDVVKGVNPEAYIVGEIWSDATPWLDATQFDAVMNYLFRDLCVAFFARDHLRADAFGTQIVDLLDRYPAPATAAQLNLLSSHDTERFLFAAGGDVDRLKLAALFQMTYPGAPCVYYGDEVGLQSPGDPYCRACFPWDTSAWTADLHAAFKSYIALRNRFRVFRTGAFRLLGADHALNLLLYAREDDDEVGIVVLNNNPRPVTIASLDVSILNLPSDTNLKELLHGGACRVRDGRLGEVRLGAFGGAVFYLDRTQDPRPTKRLSQPRPIRRARTGR